MNNPELYQREPDRTLADEPAMTPIGSNHLAIHGDPSIHRDTSGSQPPSGSRSIAWIRPSELPTTLGSGVVRRGMNAQTDAAHRLSRLPNRVTRSMIARPATPMATPARDQGLEL